MCWGSTVGPLSPKPAEIEPEEAQTTPRRRPEVLNYSDVEYSHIRGHAYDACLPKVAFARKGRGNWPPEPKGGTNFSGAWFWAPLSNGKPHEPCLFRVDPTKHEDGQQAERTIVRTLSGSSGAFIGSPPPRPPPHFGGGLGGGSPPGEEACLRQAPH